MLLALAGLGLDAIEPPARSRHWAGRAGEDALPGLGAVDLLAGDRKLGERCRRDSRPQRDVAGQVERADGYEDAGRVLEPGLVVLAIVESRRDRLRSVTRQPSDVWVRVAEPRASGANTVPDRAA